MLPWPSVLVAEADPAVRLRQVSGDRETEAAAAGGPATGLVRAPEPFEDVRQILRADPRAGVGHLEQNAVVVAAADDGHLAARWGVAHGIGDQVPQRLPQPGRIRRQLQASARGGPQHDSALVGLGLVRRGDLVDEIADVDQLGVQGQVASIGLGQIR